MPITYIQRNTDRANGIHAAIHEDALELTTAGAITETVSVPKLTVGAEAWTFTTPANEPNSSDWPNGNYRCQLDCTAAGADISYGFIQFNIPNPPTVGHIGRINGNITSDLEVNPAESFTGTGLKLADVTTDPAAGNASDRFECFVGARNINQHAAQDVTFELNTADSFADGPWVSGVTEYVSIINSGLTTFSLPETQ